MGMSQARRYVGLFAVFSMLAGCTSYGIPASPAFQQEQSNALSENCVGIRVDVVPSKDEWQRKQLQQLREALTADLKEMHGIRVIDAESPRAKNEYLLTLRPTPYLLNEPLLMVLSLGLIPQPISHYTGYQFSVSDANHRTLTEVDATHLVNNWEGWFVFLFSLSPTQTMNQEAAKEQNQKQVTNKIISRFYELGMFEGCTSAK